MEASWVDILRRACLRDVLPPKYYFWRLRVTGELVRVVYTTQFGQSCVFTLSKNGIVSKRYFQRIVGAKNFCDCP